MRFVIALSAAILSTASVASAATDRGIDLTRTGRISEERSVFENRASSMARPSWWSLSPIGSNRATDGSAAPASPYYPLPGGRAATHGTAYWENVFRRRSMS
jgi:hypothetical protein